MNSGREARISKELQKALAGKKDAELKENSSNYGILQKMIMSTNDSDALDITDYPQFKNSYLVPPTE